MNNIYYKVMLTGNEEVCHKTISLIRILVFLKIKSERKNVFTRAVNLIIVGFQTLKNYNKFLLNNIFGLIYNYCLIENEDEK